jgi:hypothetical protein
MAKRGFQGRQFSDACRVCGQKWLTDMSNKYPKRALCFECKKEENNEYLEKTRQKYKENNMVTTKEKKKPYTFNNRKGFWKSISTQLRFMNRREEWLPFIQNRMEEILNDKQLMDYINDTETANYERD